MKYYAGVDIGGTNTKIGILDNHFNILAEQSIPTLSQQGARSTFSRIWQTILDLLAQHQLSEARLEGIGLGIPRLWWIKRSLKSRLIFLGAMISMPSN